ncbi:MAG: hypothetical protein QXJ07_04900 [Candidatus Bathyarchaeia archaeon]
MGNVLVDSVIVGVLEPQTIGASGIIYINNTEVGTFGPLAASGEVLVNSFVVGTYTIEGLPSMIYQMMALMMNFVMLMMVISLMSIIVRALRRKR